MKHVVAGAGSPVAHVAAPRGPDNRFEGGPEPAGQVDFPPNVRLKVGSGQPLRWRAGTLRWGWGEFLRLDCSL